MRWFGGKLPQIPVPDRLFPVIRRYYFHRLTFNRFFHLDCFSALELPKLFSILTLTLRAFTPQSGGLAQLGERLAGSQKVTGSSPVSSILSLLLSRQ